jgi:hypothetical protein
MPCAARPLQFWLQFSLWPHGHQLRDSQHFPSDRVFNGTVEGDKRPPMKADRLGCCCSAGSFGY